MANNKDNLYEESIKLWSTLGDALSALRILKKHNRLRGDLDAYLWDVVNWGLGECDKPNPESFGIKEEE